MSDKFASIGGSFYNFEYMFGFWMIGVNSIEVVTDRKSVV